MATLFFVCINGVEKEEGLRCIDNFGGLPTRTIYDMEHRVTIPMPAHGINHRGTTEGSCKMSIH